MRIAYIVPKDRTMTREAWKYLDRQLRVAQRIVTPVLNKACLQMMVYGTSTIEVDGEWRDKVEVSHG